MTTNIEAVSYIPAVNEIWERLCVTGEGMLYEADGERVVYYEADFDELEAGAPLHNFFVIDTDGYCLAWYPCETGITERATPEPEPTRKSWFKWFTR